jgi:hypothetical protein
MGSSSKSNSLYRRNCIFILGMHRSGTSALSRVLNLLGCDLPQTLMPASTSNPHGHWESIAIMEVNEAVLKSGGSDWYDWLEFSPDWYESPVYPEFVESGRLAIQREFNTSALFVMKDPRCAKLVRFWLDVFDQEEITPHIVIPIRNPIEVSESLHARDGFHIDIVHLLWLRHVLDAEIATRGMSRVFSTYDELLDSWADVSEKIRKSFNITWPRYSATVAKEINNSLHIDSKHFASAPKSVLSSPVYSEWLRETYRIMLKWAAHGEDEADHIMLDKIGAELNAAGPAFAGIAQSIAAEMHQIRHLEERLRSAEADLSISTGELATLQSSITPEANQNLDTLAGADELHLELQDILKSAQERLVEVEAAAAEHQLQRVALQEQLSDAQTRLADMTSLAKDREQQVIVIQQDRDDVHKRLEEAEAALEQNAATTASLSSEIGRLRDQIATTESTLLQRHEEIEQTRTEMFKARDIANASMEEQEKLKIKLATADEWVFRLSGERQAALAEANKFLFRLHSNENELARARSALESMASAKQHLQLEIHRLSSLLNDTNADKDNLCNQLEEKEKELRSLSVHTNDLIKLCEDRFLWLQDAETQRNHLERLAIDRYAEIQSLRDQILDRDEKITQATLSFSQVNTKLSDSQREIIVLTQFLRQREEASLWIEDTAQAQQLQIEVTRGLEYITELTEVIAARDDQINDLGLVNSQLNSRMNERISEIAQLSNLLRLREQDVSVKSEHSDWLQQVMPVIMHTSWWWNMMPNAWRMERRYRRLSKRGLFDKTSYLNRYPDVAAAGIDPLQHYIKHGMAEGRLL